MTTLDYRAFLEAKQARINETGPEVASEDIHPMLHDWQGEIEPA